MDESGISKTLCFLGRGENFGELGIINNALRSATVITREPTELLIIHEEVGVVCNHSNVLLLPQKTLQLNLIQALVCCVGLH